MLASTIAIQGCQTLREIAALRLVDFAIDNVTDARLAGVQIERLRSYEDLSTTDIFQLGRAVAGQELPFRFNLNIAARNPDENDVQARLVRMDWTLFLEDRETISGILDQNLVFPPGQTTIFPVTIEVDLVDFFDRNLRDLVELALSVSGQGGEPKNVSLRAIPTIDTPLGEMEYPRPITIVSRDLGTQQPVSSEP
jgi:hypothetical protein